MLVQSPSLSRQRIALQRLFPFFQTPASAPLIKLHDIFVKDYISLVGLSQHQSFKLKLTVVVHYQSK
jgi:hypothetical protein